MYRLILHPDIEKYLARIPRPFAGRLAEAIQSLQVEPRPTQAKALGAELYRLRLGDYRLVYAVFDDEKVVFVGKVVRRSEKTYRDMVTLLAAARRTVEKPVSPARSASPKLSSERAKKARKET